ncbi:hypothetical protein EIN_222000 [Entamoeba invadens IP1]|uniref:Uncharacterized protein n=1 Tax=Entamoeba invadens IP1 TaxID=370355 RepID=A0A0A1U1Z8_ENTIV|nr:hypothetical protein EIN_222000 [Entamoeba invadens IP1]ELP88067.1 hypothetical protein EIN_222000 [Entamoeba invadens IP1]|eukprot:XP_004254838.1 hypothetical protein EIN_222000 [Entamoeba invadens IP1]
MSTTTTRVDVENDLDTISKEFIPKYFNVCMCCRAPLDNPRKYCLFCLAKRVEERGQIVQKRKEEIRAFQAKTHELEKTLSEGLCKINKKTDIITQTNTLFAHSQQNDLAINVMKIKENDGLRFAIEKIDHISTSMKRLQDAIKKTNELFSEYQKVGSETIKLTQLKAFLTDQIVLKKKQGLVLTNQFLMLEVDTNKTSSQLSPLTETVERPIQNELRTFRFINFFVKSTSRSFKSLAISNLFISHLFMVYKHFCVVMNVSCTLQLDWKGTTIPCTLQRRSPSALGQRVTLPDSGITFSHIVFKILYDEFLKLYVILYKSTIDVDGETYVEKLLQILHYFMSF